MTFQKRIDANGSLGGQQDRAAAFSNEVEARLMKTLGPVAARSDAAGLRRPKSDKGV